MEEGPIEFRAGFNIGPMRDVPVFYKKRGDKPATIRQTSMQWGTPQQMGISVINARFEEAKEKVMFKSIVETSRCLVPIDAYYEWIQQETATAKAGSSKGKILKVPYLIRRK